MLTIPDTEIAGSVHLLTLRLDNDGPNATKWTVMHGSKGIQSDAVSGAGHRPKAATAGAEKQTEVEDQYYETGVPKRVDKFVAGSFLGARRRE